MLVYPDVYESPSTGKLHKGETNLGGLICLSWKHVLQGIKTPNDNFNLGIHEWTHALRFNAIKYDETDYFFDAYINKWVGFAMHEFSRLKNGQPSIFRRYGAANIHEFFSVCIEHFFESPDEFRLKAPVLFDQTCILLNQIPAKNKSAIIDVRPSLLRNDILVLKNESPLVTIKASFIQTFVGFGLKLFLFGVALFTLLAQEYFFTTILAFCLCLFGVIVMNNQFFTLKFYENSLYMQSGFIESLANKLSINYNSLMKLEVVYETFDTSSGSIFQFKYYDGNQFIKKTAYCSSLDIPFNEIKTLLHEKNVAVLFHNN